MLVSILYFTYNASYYAFSPSYSFQYNFSYFLKFRR